MEEWINAVTLSLNAEMEKEKELREKAAAALAEVLRARTWTRSRLLSRRRWPRAWPRRRS